MLKFGQISSVLGTPGHKILDESTLGRSYDLIDNLGKITETYMCSVKTAGLIGINATRVLCQINVGLMCWDYIVYAYLHFNVCI